MEEQHVDLVVQAAQEHFPLSLSVPGTPTVLERQIIAIDSEQHPANGNCLSHHRDPAGAEARLWELLELLDANLGDTYARVSRALYHNTRPWRVNKWCEMLTRGLVYVVYTPSAAECRARSRGRGRAGPRPWVFLSFMLTEEDGVAADDPERVWSVVYLYEIQVAQCARGRGLGTVLMAEHLVACAKTVRDGVRAAEQFFGIELTVFGKNDAAVRFYRRLGMRRAAGGDATVTERQPQGERALYFLYALRIE